MRLLSADGDDAVGNSPGSWRVEGTLPEEVGEGALWFLLQTLASHMSHVSAHYRFSRTNVCDTSGPRRFRSSRFLRPS